MSLKQYTKPDQLEKYSFLWSQARLLIAAVALFIGGMPPFLRYNPFSGLYGTISSLHTVAYLISGAASVYLLYRWNKNHKKIFGGKDAKDTLAFFVSIVSGINLGIVGLLGTNIGMSISSSRILFFITGILYLVAMVHLFSRWNASSKKLF